MFWPVYIRVPTCWHSSVETIIKKELTILYRSPNEAIYDCCEITYEITRCKLCYKSNAVEINRRPRVSVSLAEYQKSKE